MKLVGYVRVSSKKQEDNSSLEQQITAIKRECEYRGFELVKIFTEVKSASGAVERKEFDSALQYMEDNACNGLIVYDIDRYFRNVADGLLTLKRYFSDGNYSFHCVNQRFDTGTTEGWYMFTMFLAAAEYERRKIADRTSRGRQHLAQQGYCVTPQPKFQYQIEHQQVDGKLRRVPVVNQQLLDVMHRAQIERASGKTLLQIADGLNKDKIPTKRGCVWTPKQVSRLLV